MKNSFKKVSLMFSALMLCAAFILPTSARSVAFDLPDEDEKTCYSNPCILPSGPAICCLESPSTEMTCSPCGSVVLVPVE